MPEHRLTLAQVDVLLAASRHEGPINLRDLGLAQGSGTLGSLWKHGLVQRVPGSPSSYVITEEGREEAEKYRPRVRHPVDDVPAMRYDENDTNARITIALERMAASLMSVQQYMRQYLES